MRDALVEFTPSGPGARSSFLTYEPYYGLTEKAFSLSADPRFLYQSPVHAPMFDDLRAGIRRREGIIVLTGEPGTGKTTLCRGVLASLDRKTFCAFVPDPFVSREDLLKMLLIEFGVVSVEDVKSGRLRAATRPELSYPLYDFLRSLVPLQAYAVLIIDEAQNLSSALLEEIRILADLEGPEKLLQLVLVGQPELRDKLKDQTMRQVDQRISVRCSLQPLDRDALPGYIDHRLAVAGSGDERVEFTSEALDSLYSASNGNPRLLNLLADKSLHRGHLDRTWVITPDTVMRAVGDLGYAASAPPTPERRVVERRAPAASGLSPDLFPAEESLPEEQSLPEQSLPEEPSLPADSVSETTYEGPHFLLTEPGGRDVSDAPQEDPGRRRLRLVAMLLAAGLILGVAGVGIYEWDLLREEIAQPLALPAVLDPPAQPVSAGAAPVVPPAEYFASARP